MRRSRRHPTTDTVHPLVDEEVIVHATGVLKTYDTGQVRVDALKGVDLSLRRGEMVAVKIGRAHV